jgi:hypothetical protein
MMEWTMQTSELSAGAMLLFGGLWTGAVFAVAIERSALWLQMPIAEYAIDFRRSQSRLGPALALLGLGAAISAVVFALHSGGDARRDAIAGVAGFALVVTASILLAAPIEAPFRRSAEGEIPAKADQYRRYWRRFHLGRTALALLTFGCFVAAALQRVP